MTTNDVSFHQSAVSEFPMQENCSVADIFIRIHHVYGDSYMGASSVWCWVNKSKMAAGTSPICPADVSQELRPSKAYAFLTADWGTTVTETVIQLGIGDGKDLGVQERFLFWGFPTAERWAQKYAVASMMHFRGDDLLLNNVTGNENWFHTKENCCYLQRSRSSSMIYGVFKHSSFWDYSHLTKKKVRTISSAEKIMVTLLWNAEGCKLVDFQPRNETVNVVLLLSDAPQTEPCNP